MRKIKLPKFSFKNKLKKNTKLAIYSALIVLLMLTITILLIVFNMLTYIFVPIAIGLALLLFVFLSYRKSKKLPLELYEKEFVILFTYFKVYLNNGYNIYNAIEEINNFASPFLKEKFQTLLSAIDEDKTVKPFIDFAHTFKPIIYEQLMISIYQMVEEGVSDIYLQQFQLIFNKLSEEVYKKDLDKREKRISYITSSPLVGAAMLVVLITIGVITLIGEMISGI